MEKRLGFDAPRQLGAQDRGQQLHGDLGQALGPARLLHLEAVGLDRQLRGALDRGRVDELPALKLGAIAQIGIFGERVVLPAAGVRDHRLAQDAGRAVEVEKQPAAEARDVLQHKVAVEQDRLHFGQDVMAAVQIRPARLHHADLGIGEMVHGALQKIDGRDEIGVENRDHFAGSGLQTVFERPGLVSVPVGPVDVLDGQAGIAILADQFLGEGMRIVGGIVQHLDLEQVAGIIDLGGFLQQAFDHEALIENRELDGDARQFGKAHRRLGCRAKRLRCFM